MFRKRDAPTPFDEASLDESCAAFGLLSPEAEPAAEPQFELWPENVLPVAILCDMGTSWSYGPAGGIVGLRWEALPFFLDLHGLPRDRWRPTVDALMTLESAAIALSQRSE